MTLSNRANRTNGRDNTACSQPSAEMLLNLAEDSDLEVSTLALEQLLTRPDLPEVLARSQDTNNKNRLRRIHQLSSILTMSGLREKFISRMTRNTLSVWEGLVILDRLYDSQSSESFIYRKADELRKNFSPRRQTSLSRLSQFMCDQEFGLPTNGAIWDFGLYLLGDVLTNHLGMPILLCAVAKYMMSKETPLRYCLMAGRFCLIDTAHDVIDPMDNWKVTKHVAPNLFHECSDREILTAVLSHMFAVSIVDWSPRDIFAMANLLGRVRRTDISEMPYPLGRSGLAGSLNGDYSTLRK